MNDEMIELLKENNVQNKKKLFFQRVICALMLIFVVEIAVLIPDILSTLHTTKTTMTNLNTTIAKTDTALDSVIVLANDGSSKMQEAFEKINAIDIEKLNNAISDLNDVVEPMANFFGKFK